MIRRGGLLKIAEWVEQVAGSSPSAHQRAEWRRESWRQRMMMMMVVRLHVVIQRHACEMVGWLQAIIIVRQTTVIVVGRSRAGGAAAAVIDAVYAVLQEIRAGCRPLVVVVVVRWVLMIRIGWEFACGWRKCQSSPFSTIFHKSSWVPAPTYIVTWHLHSVFMKFLVV